MAAALAVIAVGCTVWYLAGGEGTGKDRHSTARIAADASYYHVYLPSLIFDGDVDFTDEYRETKNWYRFGKTPTGRPANVFGVGPAIYEAPLFLVGHVIARLGGGRHDGFSDAEVKLSLWASVLLSVAAMWFAWRMAERRLALAAPNATLGRWLAFAGVFLAFAGGPVVYYAVRQPGYAHPFATFWTAWFLERWDASFDGEEPRGLRTWVVLGALLGAAALARPQLATWGVVLIAAVIDDVRRSWDGLPTAPLGRRAGQAALRLAPRWLAGAGAAALAFSPQLLAWKALYGSFYVVPQGADFMRWDSPAWSEVLFSSRNGLFPWSPAYAIFAIGLVVAIRRARRPAAWLLAGVVLQVIANGAVWDWWGGGSFGGRRFDSCYTAFAFGASCLLVAPAPALRRWWGARRWPALAPAGAGAAALTLLLACLAGGNLYVAGRTSTTSARIRGGEAAASVLEGKIGGPIGWAVGSASAAANFPARAAFAWRHGTDLDAYDRVVGVHFMGETYPGLNSFQPKTSDTLALRNVRSPLVQGFVPAAGSLALAGDRARILLPLNRKGRARVAVSASGPPGAPVTLRWNGSGIGGGALAAQPAEVAGDTPALRRGVNVLEVWAPPGTRLYQVELRALP